MKTFTFKLYGGYRIRVTEKDVTIDYQGEKWLFFKKEKPRTKTIPFEDMLRIDVKEAGMTFGYMRFITPVIAAYPSSTYVARHDEHAFMMDKDEIIFFNSLKDVIKKQCPQLQIVKCKS